MAIAPAYPKGVARLASITRFMPAMATGASPADPGVIERGVAPIRIFMARLAIGRPTVFLVIRRSLPRMAGNARAGDGIMVSAMGYPRVGREAVRVMAGVATCPSIQAWVVEKIRSIVSVRMAPGANLVSGYLPEGGPGGLHPGHGHMAV